MDVERAHTLLYVESGVTFLPTVWAGTSSAMGADEVSLSTSSVAQRLVSECM